MRNWRGAIDRARTSATASTVGRGRWGRSSSRRRGKAAKPSALSTSRTAVGPRRNRRHVRTEAGDKPRDAGKNSTALAAGVRRIALRGNPGWCRQQNLRGGVCGYDAEAIAAKQKGMNSNEQEQAPLTQVPRATPAFTASAGTPSPLSEMDQLVRGERILEMFWPETASRPSMAWLRKQVKARQIPFVKRGRRVWYIPKTVKAWFDLKETKPLLMLQHEHDQKGCGFR